MMQLPALTIQTMLKTTNVGSICVMLSGVWSQDMVHLVTKPIVAPILVSLSVTQARIRCNTYIMILAATQ